MSEGARDLLVRGIAAAKAGDRAEARHFLEWALRQQPTGEQELEAKLWLSEACEAPEEARRWLEDVLAGDPTHVDALLGRAQVLNWAGRHRDARAAYFEIRNVYPDNGDARLGFASAQYWTGRTDLARRTIASAEKTPATTALMNEFGYVLDALDFTAVDVLAFQVLGRGAAQDGGDAYVGPVLRCLEPG